jgi:hypothetical protein
MITFLTFAANALHSLDQYLSKTKRTEPNFFSRIKRADIPMANTK